MSQIASFYLVKNDRRTQLADSGCSGEAYIAIWDWCEGELGIDSRIDAPQSEDVLDCVLIDSQLAEKLWSSFAARNITPPVWPQSLHWIGIYQPRHCREDWKRPS